MTDVVLSISLGITVGLLIAGFMFMPKEPPND
jgi:hypothetical protein